MAKKRLPVPRSHLTEPVLFGLTRRVVWVQPKTVDSYLGMRAAETQHLLALAVVEFAREESGGLGDLSERIGLGQQRLGKIIHGHVNMTVRDLSALEGYFGPILRRLPVDRTPIDDPTLLKRFPGERSRPDSTRRPSAV